MKWKETSLPCRPAVHPRRKMCFATALSTPQGRHCCWPPGTLCGAAPIAQGTCLPLIIALCPGLRVRGTNTKSSSSQRSPDSRSDPEMQTQLYNEMHQPPRKVRGAGGFGAPACVLTEETDPQRKSVPQRGRSDSSVPLFTPPSLDSLSTRFM